MILAGGEPEDPTFVRAWTHAEDLVLAADGGARLALAAGIGIHAVIGDLDSLSEEDQRALPRETRIFRHPPEKDASDLELALDVAFSLAPREVIVLGAMGGRADHFLTNVGLLHRGTGVPIRLVGSRAEIRLLDGGSATLDVPAGTIVSLVPLVPRVEGVTLRGFHYPLENEALHWGTSRGLSNVVDAPPARIEAGRGVLALVIVSGPEAPPTGP